jgi:hypothetical protein
VTAPDRAERERQRRRLVAGAVKAARKREHALVQKARTLDRLDELDRELKAAADGLDLLDRLDETGGEP